MRSPTPLALFALLLLASCTHTTAATGPTSNARAEDSDSEPPPVSPQTSPGAEAEPACVTESWVHPTPDAEPLFEIDSLELRRDAEPQIAALRARLAESTSPIVAIEWYGADTSERGLDLTRRRAQRLLVALREGAPEGAVIEARGCYASAAERSRPSLAVLRLCPEGEHVWCEQLPAHRVGGADGVWRVAER